MARPWQWATGGGTREVFALFGWPALAYFGGASSRSSLGGGRAAS
uniref:Uncharacterized protein n=1 Tax=Arundo donax TaxID=35708 RepID=A0A0A9AD84_ARUDO